MTTGIFSISRVAGEGVVLALVTAMLSALTGANLGTAAGGRGCLAACYRRPAGAGSARAVDGSGGSSVWI